MSKKEGKKSREEEQISKEEEKIGHVPALFSCSVFVEQPCFNTNWILQSNKQGQLNDYICLICKQVASNAFEINCPQHQDLDKSLIVGERCLKQFLNANPNSCPVQVHDGCVYNQVQLAQRYINDLEVMCPLQFQETQQEDEITETIVCNFKGKIKELKDHLDNACPLKMVDCWYKPFGCRHTCVKHKLQDHLVLEVKPHFDLVAKLIGTLRQAIRDHQEEIKQLKSNMQAKDEENAMLANENRSLKKEVLQFRQDIIQLNSSKEFSILYLLELEKFKKEVMVKVERLKKEIMTKSDQVIKIKEEIALKQKEWLEKDNETEKIQREISKAQSDIEMLRQDFNEKDEKNVQDSHKLYQKDEQKDNKNLSSCTSFDRFCSSSGLLKTFAGHTDYVWGIDSTTFDNNQLICSGSSDKTVRVWNVETGKQIQLFDGHSSDVYCVKFSLYHYYHQGRTVICSSSHDRTIRFWDFKNGQSLRIFDQHTNWVGRIEFSPFNGDRYLCSVSFDKTVRLWDVETSKLLFAFNGHTDGVWCVSFSPLQSNNNNNNNNDKSNNIGIIGGNGYTICSGSYDRTIRIWDIETFKQLIAFKGHKKAVSSVRYSPHETNIILSGACDGTVRLWDIRSKKQIQKFDGHTREVSAAEYLPFVTNEDNGDGFASSVGNIICSGSWDNTIRFWDIRTNKELHVIKANHEDRGVSYIKFLSLKNRSNADHGCNTNLCYGSKVVLFIFWDNTIFNKLFLIDVNFQFSFLLI
ncbi:G-protein beta WD-40 repeats containing protein [Reticulomyxa filosa]|uniref:G-protein beta WD-40 repeats containing protein n=1 Tax=Reticulomyxa filosa TaxID=46433 RepID=X6NKQ9_RETFI|nr:G-protein beta WD-40 repeats containing protein [Reticulomyxa filosa]|eukprot:ETO26870.1 G-protein beta WD-40 repeats containing protein [Reticulomyxa filosa]